MMERNELAERGGKWRCCHPTAQSLYVRALRRRGFVQIAGHGMQWPSSPLALTSGVAVVATVPVMMVAFFVLLWDGFLDDDGRLGLGCFVVLQ
jgi:hypothetical protein